MARYCSAADSRDGAAGAQLFTADGKLVLSSQTFAGHESLRRFLSGGPKASGRHHSGNLVVDFVDVDSARATSYVTVLEAGKPIQRIGTYVDDLVRVDGRWLIRRRVLVWDE